MNAPRAIGFLFAAALLLAAGCSDSGSGGMSSSPVFACTDGGAAGPDAVTMVCGLTVSTTERVDVFLGGPASGTTSLSGVNFDVVYDPAKIHFVQAGSYATPLFPGALVAVALAGGTEGRIIVSIQEPGGTPPVNVVAGQNLVLSLNFQSVLGVNYAPSPVTFENSEATGASAPITFGSSLAMSFQ